MNTAVLNALKQVREAKTMVLSSLTDTTIDPGEKRILGGILINLQEQEDTLINFTLQDMADKINASNAALKTLIQQMDDASQNLAGISNAIKKISGVLSTLTDIITKALSAGLLGW
jgi:hypothetical protein